MRIPSVLALTHGLQWRSPLLALAISACALSAAGAADISGDSRYRFDGKISQPVLENYLARSLNMLDLAFEDAAAMEEDLRMVKNVGAKHLGFVTFVWLEGDAAVDVDEHFNARSCRKPRSKSSHTRKCAIFWPIFRASSKRSTAGYPACRETRTFAPSNRG